MAIDPRKLKPSDLTRLLNSTPLGTVLDERQLYRHRMRAGYRIGDGKRVDLLRYVAWLYDQVHAPKKTATPEEEYEALKARAAARSRDLSRAGRDIGDLPAVADPVRKTRGERSFRYFCEAYFPRTFHLPWSADHLKVVERIETAALHGGLYALAMARGSGKTSLAECACLWAVLYGHQNFVCLVGASEVHAAEMLESIKMELEGNELLAADFPEVCYPIACLDGIANRCAGQLYRGERTHIGWTADEVVLPTIAGSKASGAILKVAGITGRVRGMKFKRPDGRVSRPGLVVFDDPQTDESARSLSQCNTRERIVKGAVAGLAGPGKKIAALMPCTVIRPGDMADRFLDREKNPDWNGERMRMLYAFPTDEKLWARYAEIATKTNGMRRGEVPIGVTHLTAFVDVQGKLLFWAVVGWEDDFTGYVLDYGAYPDQRREYFTLREAQRTLQLAAKGAGLEGAIYAGLEALTGDLLGREWHRDDGACLKIGRCLVDANWGTSTDVVYQFCRQSPHAAVLLPSHGRFVGAASIPFSEYRRRKGDRLGLNWRIPNVQGKRAIRHVLYDTNWWKTFLHARLAVAMGDRGCLSLYGRDPEAHRLLAEHLTAEYRVKTAGRGRTVDEWRLRPEGNDNHWLDGLVGCAVAAAIEGAVLPGTDAKERPKRNRVKLSALQRGGR
jgi:hypothetical protein